MGKLSAIAQPTQPSILVAGKCVVMHVITWITWLETIKRQTMANMAVWMQAKVRERWLVLQPTLYTGSFCVVQYTAATCFIWRCVGAFALAFFLCKKRKVSRPITVSPQKLSEVSRQIVSDSRTRCTGGPVAEVGPCPTNEKRSSSSLS